MVPLEETRLTSKHLGLRVVLFGFWRAARGTWFSTYGFFITVREVEKSVETDVEIEGDVAVNVSMVASEDGPALPAIPSKSTPTAIGWRGWVWIRVKIGGADDGWREVMVSTSQSNGLKSPNQGTVFYIPVEVEPQELGVLCPISKSWPIRVLGRR
jgi:hypothetical protein